MMNRPKRIGITALLAGVCWTAGIAAAAVNAAPMQVWSVDPLIKIFRDAAPATGVASEDEARGQTATFQIVVRSDSVLKDLECQAGPLRDENSSNATALMGAEVRYVGYVPVDRSLSKPPKDRVRKPPADFPDPLFDEAPAEVKGGEAQPIWITLKIPLDCQPGIYHGHARISAKINGATERSSASVPLTIKIYPDKVEHTRLWVTNWFQPNSGYKPMPKDYSPEFWQMLRLYARDMAAHRQTVARTVPLELAQYKFDANGDITDIDWSRMDQWIQIFIDEGVIGRIEGQQFAWRKGKWNSPYVVSTYVPDGNGVKEVKVDPESAEAAKFYSRFLPMLQQHVLEKGWGEIWMQHVGDEPDNFNFASYEQVAALVKKYAPKLRRMDAILTPKVVRSMEVMVPLLNVLHDNWGVFNQRQTEGEELWFYICGNPQGEYANRELEMPLIKVRLLPWIDFRYGIKGFLHWGYNFWNKVPDYQKQMKLVYGTGRPDAFPGDAWIVYPKLNGLGVNDSIRWEAQRDGCEDHELLSQLAERDSTAANRIAKSIILDFNRYDTSIKDFRKTQRELLEDLSKADSKSETKNKVVGMSSFSGVITSGELLADGSRLNTVAVTAMVRLALWRIENV